MSFDDEMLEEFLGEEMPISSQTRRVAELLRLPGAADRWRQQCQVSQRHMRHETWHMERMEYAAKNFCEGSVAGSTPQADEWTWGSERLVSPAGDKTAIVRGWFPPEFGTDKEPFNGSLLPFSKRHPPSLADNHLVLAVVHDAERRGPGKINPFSPDDIRV